MHGFDRFVEEVNGIVIGPITQRCAVYSPNGSEIAVKHFEISDDDSERKKWAEGVVAKRRAEVGEVECKHLGWDKPWELRIYN